MKSCNQQLVRSRNGNHQNHPSDRTFARLRKRVPRPPALSSINPLEIEKVSGGESKRRAKKYQEAWGNHELPTRIEVFQYLKTTSAVPIQRTTEQEWNFKERNEDPLDPDNVYSTP